MDPDTGSIILSDSDQVFKTCLAQDPDQVFKIWSDPDPDPI